MPAANSSRCSRASSIPTSWSCSNCGRTRRRSPPTPNCRRSARLCRRGCGSALASARTTPTTVPAERGGAKMQVSYFETGRYYAPSNLPREWPMPAGAYDREAGLRAFRGMVERSRYVEELGFDWVSVSEHHYSPRILTPSLPIAAAYIASHVHNIKIALLGPIVPQSNPVLLAEEMAMLDTMAEGRLIVGMLRGTTNEMLTYDLNPEESRERTDEGMELILRAWREPQPFGWQGRHFHYRTVSVWPNPRHQPRGERLRGAQPCRPRRLVRPVRRNGQGDRLLQGRVRALRLAAGAAPDHLPRQHRDRRDRRESAAGVGAVSAAGGVPAEGRGRRRAVGTRSAQRRWRGAAASQCQPGAAAAIPPGVVRLNGAAR